MQISFDPRSSADVLFVKKLLASLEADSHAQPEVASNTGSAVEKIASSQARTEGAASNILPLDAAAIKDRKKKPAREVTLEQTIDEIPDPLPEANVDGARKALSIFTTAKGITEGLNLLKKYQANRIAELKSDVYADFIKDCINGAR
jgi:hypothetical protein